MFTLLRKRIKRKRRKIPLLGRARTSFTRMKFLSGTSYAIQRLQIIWALGLLLILLSVSYGIVVVFFDKPAEFEDDKKPEPLLIQTSSNKVNLNEVRYNKLEEENKKLSEDLKALKDVFQESLKDKSGDQALPLQNLTERIEEVEAQLAEQSQNAYPNSTCRCHS